MSENGYGGAALKRQEFGACFCVSTMAVRGPAGRHAPGKSSGERRCFFSKAGARGVEASEL